MTDNEIIKALECLAGGFGILCRDCAFNGKFPCRENAAKSALDLIKRLQDENDRYKEQCSKCGEKTRKTIIYLQDLLAEQKAEIERLHSEVKEKTETIVLLKDEAIGWCNDFCNLKAKLNTAKTEAIKEFAERLKEELDISVCGYSSEEVTYQVEDTIDNLVKKMTEGKQDAVQDTRAGAE